MLAFSCQFPAGGYAAALPVWIPEPPERPESPDPPEHLERPETPGTQNAEPKNLGTQNLEPRTLIPNDFLIFRLRRGEGFVIVCAVMTFNTQNTLFRLTLLSLKGDEKRSVMQCK